MNEIQLKVTVDEANLILEGLGHLPFAKVYALVAKVQEQANRQLSAGPSEVTPEETPVEASAEASDAA